MDGDTSLELSEWNNDQGNYIIQEDAINYCDIKYEDVDSELEDVKLQIELDPRMLLQQDISVDEEDDPITGYLNSETTSGIHQTGRGRQKRQRTEVITMDISRTEICNYKTYVIDRYNYIYDVKTSQKFCRIRCCQFRSENIKCMGRAKGQVFMENGVLQRVKNLKLVAIHNHQPDLVAVVDVKLRKSCHDRAINEPHTYLRTIYKQEADRFSMASISFNDVSKSMQNERRKHHSVLDSSLFNDLELSARKEEMRSETLEDNLVEYSCDTNNEDVEVIRVIVGNQPKSHKTYVVDSNNFVYLIHSLKNIAYLRCWQSRSAVIKCRARARAIPFIEDSTVVDLDNFYIITTHNHEANISEVHSLKLRAVCYERVTTELDTPMNHIFKQEFSNYPHADLKYKALRQGMRRERKIHIKKMTINNSNSRHFSLREQFDDDSNCSITNLDPVLLAPGPSAES